jgi:hypothetical protein
MKMRMLVGCLLVVGSLGFSSCQRGNGQTVKTAPAVAAQQAEKPAKAVYYCAGKTKTGQRCRKHVKAEGLYCWMHKDQQKGGK